MRAFRARISPPAVFGLLVAVICSACGRDLTGEKVVVKNVVRIFMHEPLRYSFLVQENETNVLNLVSLPHDIKIGKEPIEISDVPLCAANGNSLYRIQNVKFVADVPDGEFMWATAMLSGRTDMHPSVHLLEIHIHSPNDIDGAGWNHGKFGSGSTQVVK